jgi:hypothetical protein
VLRIAVNFADTAVAIDRVDATPFFASEHASPRDTIAPATCAAWLLDA